MNETERDEEIVRRAKAGEAFTSIGVSVHLSSARVGQIVKSLWPEYSTIVLRASKRIGKRPRGRCPLCGRDVAINYEGDVWPHVGQRGEYHHMIRPVRPR